MDSYAASMACRQNTHTAKSLSSLLCIHSQYCDELCWGLFAKLPDRRLAEMDMCSADPDPQLSNLVSTPAGT
jgi:hypothetical protein